MKNHIKRVTLAICAAIVSAMIVSAPAFAAADGARQQPGTGENSAYTTSAGDPAVVDQPADANSVTSSTGTVTTNSVTAGATTASQGNTGKKYQSRLGGFLWFLLSVVVNFIISCWVGNRFYRLAKRNAQGSSEIRALRKDIEEKFSSTLRDISEPAVEVINQNESYARTDEGLSMPEKRGHIELNEEEREMMRKWDARRAASKSAAEPEDDDDEDYEDEPRRHPAGRSYQPTRRSSGIDFEDDEDDEDDVYEDDVYEDEDYEDRARTKERPAGMNVRRTAAKKTAGKAKKFLNNVFPFDE